MIFSFEMLAGPGHTEWFARLDSIAQQDDGSEVGTFQRLIQKPGHSFEVHFHGDGLAGAGKVGDNLRRAPLGPPGEAG